ncbi:MAG: hypothetical protein U0031_19840 [Thermomicrobiales bacterium]
MSRPFEQEVRSDFDRARTHAFLTDLRALFARRRNDLVSFHEVRRRVAPESESYRGMQSVRLDQIVGSVDRFQDFNREYLPRQKFTAGRWQNVDRSYYQDVQLPPVQLYKVGDVYFVKDGNHRVSVARERGQEYIDAEVIEGHIRAPLYPEMSPNELLLQAEYAEFLRRSDLDRSRPDHDIRPSALGRYDEIWSQIEGHRDWLSAIRHAWVPDQDAASDWFDYIYCPIIEVARRQGLTERFPDRTEADVYLWVMRHRRDIEQDLGHDIGPAPAAEDYAEATSQPAAFHFVGEALRGLRSLPERISLRRD